MIYTELVTAIQDYVENNFPTADINRFIEQAEQRIYNSVQIPSLRKNVTGQVSPANAYLACPQDWLSTFSIAAYTYTSGTIGTTTGSSSITTTGVSNIQVGQLVTASGIPVGTVVISVGSTTANLSAVATATASVSASFQGPYSYLLNKDVSFIREAYAYPSTTGLPLYYALFGAQSSNILDMTFILGPTPDQVYNMELHYNYYPQSIVTASETWLGDNFDTALLNYCLMEAITYIKGEPDLVTLYQKRADDAMALLKQLGDAKEKGDSYRDGNPKYKVV